MKPLNTNTSKQLLDRFSNFTDATLNEIKIVDPQTVSLIFSVQDSSREFDWIDLDLQIGSVSEVFLIDHNKLKLVDMNDGVTILFENNYVGFSIGKHKSISSLKDAPLFLIGKSIKFEELDFSN
jgi:hypothetical protein